MAIPPAETLELRHEISHVTRTRKQKPFRMNQIDAPSPGQVWARTRWNTQESGAAFDRKKQPYLAPDMKVFAESQDFCIVSFVDDDGQVSGRLLHGHVGEFTTRPTTIILSFDL